MCHYGLFATTRRNLLAHPRTVYSRVANKLSQHSSAEVPEDTFYLEWGAHAVYGILDGRAKPECTGGLQAWGCTNPMRATAGEQAVI